MKSYKLIILFLFIFFIGFGIGYVQGSINTIKWGIDFAREFVTIEMDTDMIASGIYQYKNHIGGCLFTQNASIFNDTRNQA